MILVLILFESLSLDMFEPYLVSSWSRNCWIVIDILNELIEHLLKQRKENKIEALQELALFNI